MTKIRVRDVNENNVGQVSDYIEAIFAPKWNGVGTWSIKILADSPAAAFLLPGCGVNAVLPDGYVFSGHATDFLDEWNIEGDSGEGTITIVGIEDKAILGYRCVLPSPAADYTAQTAVASYTQTGPAETLVKTLVSLNLGNTALATRMLPNLVIEADSAFGASSTISARYDNLLDLVQRIASPVSMGFNLVSTGGGGWLFTTQRPVVTSVEFSRQVGNMTSHSYGQKAPTATRAIVAGAGTGIARNVRVYDQPLGAVDPAWGYLVESFLDRRDTSLASDMAQAAAEAFASGTEQQSISVTVIDTDNMVLGKDYGLGSTVSVKIRGTKYTDIVSQIVYTLKPDAVRIQPTIGSAEGVYGRALDIYRVVRSIAARTALLERRY